MDTLYWLAQMRRILLKFPATEDYFAYRTPAFRVKKKMICRLWKNGEVLVVHANDRDIWLKAYPEIFFVTEHYQNYPLVLVKLEQVTEDILEKLLTEAWFQLAPPAVMKAYRNSA